MSATTTTLQQHFLVSPLRADNVGPCPPRVSGFPPRSPHAAARQLVVASVSPQVANMLAPLLPLLVLPAAAAAETTTMTTAVAVALLCCAAACLPALGLPASLPA